MQNALKRHDDPAQFQLTIRLNEMENGHHFLSRLSEMVSLFTL
jgi:hypothetical protein